MKPPVLSSGLALASAVAVLALAAATATPARASGAPSVADSSGTASAPTQRTRMKTCNAEAHDKHGAERRAFMKQCLSKKGAASAAG